MTLDNHLPLQRLNNIVIQEAHNEVLIYDLISNKAYCLNETCAIVWHLCNGKNSLEDIHRNTDIKLQSSFSKELVWLALDELKRNNLIVNSETIQPSFNNLSRREVIRKVGLGSLVALPVIASIIAPSAVHAQSISSCMSTVMGPPGSMFGGCTDISEAACQASCNAPLPFGAAPIVCASCAAVAVSCVPDPGGATVMCGCECA